MGAVAAVTGVFGILTGVNFLGIRDLLNELGNSIFGKVRETFSDVAVVPILSVGDATKNARKRAYLGSGGSAEAFSGSLMAFKRFYKRSFRESVFRNLGYLPNSSAVTRTIVPALVAAYLQDLYSYGNVNIVNAEDTYIDKNNKCNYGRQFLDGYDFATGKVVLEGKTYSTRVCNEVTDTGLEYVLVREYTESIIENLTDNYEYDEEENTVTFEGELYLVGELSSVVDEGEYVTICVHVDETLPDLEIRTPVESFTESYSNALFSQEVTFVAYVVTSGEVPNTVRYFMVKSATLDVYSSTTVNVAPILTIRRYYSNIDPDNTTLKQALKRFGLKGADFTGSLNNPDIHSAYLTMAVDPRVDNKAHNGLIFRMFDLMTVGNGNVVISIDNLNMTYEFTVAKTTVLGSIGAVGTYTKTLQPYSIVTTGTDVEGIPTTSTYIDTRMVLRYQGSSTEYREIIITRFLQRYTVLETVAVGLNDPDGECRLIVPLDLLNSLRYNDWVDVYERGLIMIAYAHKTVEMDWYYAGWVNFVIQIIGLVLTVLLPPAGGFWMVLAQMAITYVIVRVAIWIAEAIGGEFGMAIAAVFVIVAMYYGQSYGILQSSGWLANANQYFNTINQVIQHQIEMEMVAAQRDYTGYMKEKQQQVDDLNEKLKEYETASAYNYAMNVFKELEASNRPNPMFHTIESYVSSIVNTEWMVEGSWMYDVTGEVEKRNKVYVGN